MNVYLFWVRCEMAIRTMTQLLSKYTFISFCFKLEAIVVVAYPWIEAVLLCTNIFEANTLIFSSNLIEIGCGGFFRCTFRSEYRSLSLLF